MAYSVDVTSIEDKETSMESTKAAGLHTSMYEQMTDQSIEDALEVLL